MLPTDVLISQAPTVLAVGPTTMLAITAVAVLFTILILGTVSEVRDRATMTAMNPPLAPPDRAPARQAA